MKTIVLLTNILTPYRQSFYDGLYAECKRKEVKFHILVMAETERDRRWKYHELEREYTELLEKKVYLGKTDSFYVNPNLIKKLEELKPDILILSGSYTLFPVWKALKWGKKQGCKIFFWSESHLDEVRGFNKPVYMVREIVRKKFYRQFSGFWYPGVKAKELIMKYADKDATYIQVPNLIHNELFEKELGEICATKEQIRDKYGLSRNKLIFFSPVRLIAVKGILPFLKEVAEMDFRDELQIVIAGEGELEEEIREFVKTKELSVILLGYRVREEIIENMYAADCFLLPSLSDPNPLACIEALWCEKPLFVSEHVGNYPEVVAEGKNGYVFSYAKPDELRDKIELIVHKNRQWYEEAAKYSKQTAEKCFDTKKNCERIIEVLLNTD